MIKCWGSLRYVWIHQNWPWRSKTQILQRRKGLDASWNRRVLGTLMKASYQQYGLQFKRPVGLPAAFWPPGNVVHPIGQRFAMGVRRMWIIAWSQCGRPPSLRSKAVLGLRKYRSGIAGTLRTANGISFHSNGFEMAFRSLEADNPFHLFPSAFTLGTQPISINGLIWMGAVFFMKEQIREKLDAGFRCLKMKIGALDFDTGMHFCKRLEKNIHLKDLELRVDANGAFSPSKPWKN